MSHRHFLVKNYNEMSKLSVFKIEDQILSNSNSSITLSSFINFVARIEQLLIYKLENFYKFLKVLGRN